MPELNIARARRAEIGAQRRQRTRTRLLAAARRLFGHEGGRATKIEDLCEEAGIARGTFYNYFPSFDALQEALFEELSMRFDEAVHEAFEQLEGPAGRTSAAMRYYLMHVVQDREWGWGMVNTGMGIGFFHDKVTERVAETIQQGIDSGDFTIDSAEAGRDLLLGSGLAAANTLLAGGVCDGYIVQVAIAVLKGLGVADDKARLLVKAELPELPLSEPGLRVV